MEGWMLGGFDGSFRIDGMGWIKKIGLIVNCSSKND